METTLQQVIHQIGYFFILTKDIFLRVDIHERLYLISGFLMFFFGLNLLFTIPLIFNFFVIPKIEKKVGKKLEYKNRAYCLCFFGSYFIRYSEIADYIVDKALRKEKKHLKFMLYPQ